MAIYGVHRTDRTTGQETRIDIIDVPAGYSIQDYLRDANEDISPERKDFLLSGELSLVLLPDKDTYTLPKEIPSDGPKDIV